MFVLMQWPRKEALLFCEHCITLFSVDLSHMIHTEALKGDRRVVMGPFFADKGRGDLRVQVVSLCLFW